MSVTINEIQPAIGVEVAGMSGAQLVSRDAADECQRLLDAHGVVVYREVSIDDDELLAFSRMLGTLVVQSTGEHDYPEIQTITLDPTKTNALLASYRQGNFLWHFDGATDELPQKGTLLSAREVDPAGGDTQFATTYAAYEALPDSEKAEIADLKVVHSFAAAQAKANPDASAQERASWDRVPARVHPLVWTRRNGRKSLLLGATTAEVVDWPAEKSQALLDRLLAWSTKEQFTLRHHWRRGDLVMWDNTGMLHRALPFEPTSRRLMHRTTLVGEEAVTAC
jgi:alpha-ketoglutarate-dependent taurine dioxygenase